MLTNLGLANTHPGDLRSLGQVRRRQRLWRCSETGPKHQSTSVLYSKGKALAFSGKMVDGFWVGVSGETDARDHEMEMDKE